MTRSKITRFQLTILLLLSIVSRLVTLLTCVTSASIPEEVQVASGGIADGQEDTDTCSGADYDLSKSNACAATDRTLDDVNKISLERQSQEHKTGQNIREEKNNTDSASDSGLTHRNRPTFFPDCRLYLAPSTLVDPEDSLDSNYRRRLGLYTVQSIPRGHPVGPPDILVHLTDYPESLSTFVSLHSFEASQFGAQYEAKKVASVLAGIASLAQSTTMAESNVFPFYGRDMDEADVPRTVMPGAGALTHYHNLTFLAMRQLEAGSEIWVGIPGGGEEWSKTRMERIQQRDGNRGSGVSSSSSSSNGSGSIGETTASPYDATNRRRGRRSVDWIQQNGICVDHLRPQKSRQKGVGRGAFAVRYIPKGSIVSASPLIPLDRHAAVTKAVSHGGRIRNSKPQLLVNYCLGHVNSSVLFYPTAPVVNLINHGDADRANVELRWSTVDGLQLGQNGWNVSSVSVEDLLSSSSSSSSSRFYDSDELVMEYVAKRDIQPNEEILMDYGRAWSLAWEKHVQDWKPPPNAIAYSPSYVMDDVAGLLRTEKEQASHPYPSNLMTACFYRYSTHQRNDGIVSSSSSNRVSAGETTAVQWKMDKRTFDYRNLRPCQIIQREDIDGKIAYTVIMKNWIGMKKEEMIPKNEIHVVKSIPRNAIRFVDKLYTTDMHLSNAFRHEIQIPNDIFPCAWMDLDAQRVCGETTQETNVA